MQDNDYKLYVLAEIAYKKEHENESEDLIFPADWYSIKNYKSKVEMIAEAIKKKCIIQYTDLYKERVEGIKILNKD